MQLSELVGHNGDFGGLDISGLALDSRQVKPGYLFAALKGFRVDGRQFIPEAVKRGAVAVLTGPETVEGLTDVVLVTDPNPRSRLARIAARFFGQQPAHLAAVTGTNGKTSVAHFTRQIWTLLGREAASIGTLGVEGTKVHADRGLTTPDCLTFQRTLAELAEMGTQRAVVEASSHGLSQYRLEGARFSAAAFTNLSRDHLDYHQTFEEYFAAKARLFAELLPEDGTAVINLEGAYGPEIEKICRARGLKTIGIALGHGEINVERLKAGTAGTTMSVGFEGTDYEIELPLVGGFQASNALVAAGIVIAAGEDPGAVFGALDWLKGVPGRLEAVGKTPAGGRVFVDYAHTPDGLENILQVARTITPGALVIVFGCGGDRDRGKRGEMGELAHNLADRVIVTDDNPRSEDPAFIRAEILAKAPGAREFDDRAAAIFVAMTGLADGDTLLVTGKGHETGQIVGDQVLPFNDFEVIREGLQRMKEEGGER